MYDRGLVCIAALVRYCNRIWIVMQTSLNDEVLQKMNLTSLRARLMHYLISRTWLGSQVKHECKTRREWCIIGWIWQMTCTRLWRSVRNASRTSLLRYASAHYNYFRKVACWDLSWWTCWDHYQKMSNGNKLVLLMRDLKFTRGVSMSNSTASHIDPMFMNHSNVPNGNPDLVLMDNRT